MKEEFLHYVWNFQKFHGRLATSTGEHLEIIHPGVKNLNSGPDFFNAQIVLQDQHWAGNVEIHIKSSDWYAHHHEKDNAYDNVILHVVWEHDTAIFRKDNTIIPTLELNNLVNPSLISSYENLMVSKQKWINCENEISQVDPIVIKNWFDRLYFERLQHKTTQLETILNKTNNDWEALLFVTLAKYFGLKTNGESFLFMAQSVDFSIVKKCAQEQETLEALLLGQAGLLDEEIEDGYYKNSKKIYAYLCSKYKLQEKSKIKPLFFRLRPPNFPTIRISQLAQLYSKNKNLFSQIIEAKELPQFYKIFNVTASSYWDTHYNFQITSSKRKKKLTNKFINLLLINAIIPIKFSYAVHKGEDNSDEIASLISNISKEENTIITKFNKLKPIIKTALDSQAVLQLKNHYCDVHKCLQCAIGNHILKTSN
jgi:hypothetical protein